MNRKEIGSGLDGKGDTDATSLRQYTFQEQT